MHQFKVTVTRKSNQLRPGQSLRAETVIYAKDRREAIAWAKKFFNVALSSIRARRVKANR